MSEVVVSGRRLPLSRAFVRRVVEAVLEAERREGLVSVTFLGRDSMRRLNAEHKGHDRPTDVLTFALGGPKAQVIGDVYVCPWVARREARARRIPLKQELIRLVVHGTLHALGREHPEGPHRTRSAMWRRQERYVQALT
ncbi:MAG: rRNA maturation RNase YbeY [Gemmatimonadales bacterium]